MASFVSQLGGSFGICVGIVTGGVEERIYAAGLDFDAAGLPFLTEAPVEVLSGGPPVELDGITLVTRIRAFDWSPDGTRVVWARHIHEKGVNRTSDPKDLMVTDLSTGNTRLLAAGIEPEWSPDNQRIAFVWLHDSGSVGAIATIALDGTGYLELTSGGNRILYDRQPRWSPDSGHIAFTRLTASNKGGRTTFFNNILRIPATGGKTKNLTDDIDNADALGWR
jgi:Tol biopolymer transport system component